MDSNVVRDGEQVRLQIRDEYGVQNYWIVSTGDWLSDSLKMLREAAPLNLWRVVAACQRASEALHG